MDQGTFGVKDNRAPALALAQWRPGSGPWAVGDSLDIQWGHKTFQAQVTQVGPKKVKVHFPGWDDSHDEWIAFGDERIKTAPPAREAPAAAAPQRPASPRRAASPGGARAVAAPPGAGAWQKGDVVVVDWGASGKAFPATVLIVGPKKVKVRYDGFDASNDEWIEMGAERMRRAEPAAAP